MSLEAPFLKSMTLLEDRVGGRVAYPFTIPAVQALVNGLPLSSVTYFVGENGSGKSTILEAVAVACGFNAEGGTINFNFKTRRSESALHECIRFARTPKRPRTGFFLRAESFFNVATEIERLDAEPAFAAPVIDSYGSRSLHEQSHGESFLALVRHRFGPNGLYIQPLCLQRSTRFVHVSRNASRPMLMLASDAQSYASITPESGTRLAERILYPRRA